MATLPNLLTKLTEQPEQRVSKAIEEAGAEIVTEAAALTEAADALTKSDFDRYQEIDAEITALSSGWAKGRAAARRKAVDEMAREAREAIGLIDRERLVVDDPARVEMLATKRELVVRIEGQVKQVRPDPSASSPGSGMAGDIDMTGAGMALSSARSALASAAERLAMPVDAVKFALTRLTVGGLGGVWLCDWITRQCQANPEFRAELRRRLE